VTTARLAILDRDGTLIDVVRDEETGAISTAFHPDHVRFLEGAIEGARVLQEAGFLLAVATNQPGPARGQYSEAAVQRTNDAMVAKLAAHGVTIARVEVCMHHPSVAPCACRKPLPGMLEAILSATGADRAQSWMIGDAANDVLAGRAARLKTGLVFRADRCELCPLRGGPALTVDVHGATLPDVARAILTGRK
jgi:D-glycero-D-manno-heptose 1,7-bisphosphate phosphatase